MSLPTFTEAQDAIRTLFLTAWREDAAEAIDGPEPPIHWDGVDSGAPPGAVTHARYFLKHLDGKQASLGAIGRRRFTRYGLVTIQIFVPVVSKNSKALAGKLGVVARGAYEGVGTDDGIWFRNVAIKDIGPDKGLYQVNVTAEFQYDELV